MPIPQKITAGDTLKFSLPEVEYSHADGWAMKVQLVNADTTIDMVGVYNNGVYDFTLPVDQSASLTLGKYRATQRVEKGAGATLERHSLSSLITEVVGGLAAGVLDVRGHAAKMLSMIEAVLEKRATTDVLKYEIRGRSLERMPVEDLIKWRKYYQMELKKEEAAQSGNNYSSSRRYRMTLR